MSKHRFLLLVLALAVSSALVGCGGKPATEQAVTLAPLHEMHADVQNAPVRTQEAYQFAVANADLHQQLPCYCGCGNLGHVSLYDCYVEAVEADGTSAFDTHALGCAICVDISQDALRLLKQGQSPGAIKDYIDQTYAKYGPSNMP